MSSRSDATRTSIRERNGLLAGPAVCAVDSADVQSQDHEGELGVDQQPSVAHSDAARPTEIGRGRATVRALRQRMSNPLMGSDDQLEQQEHQLNSPSVLDPQKLLIS